MSVPGRRLGIRGILPRGIWVICLFLAPFVDDARGEAAETGGEDSSALIGRVLDGPTGLPIAGVVVRVGDVITVTDDEGAYHLALPPGSHVLEVYAELPGGRSEALHQTGLRIGPGETATRTVNLVTDAFLADHPMRVDGIGVPISRPAEIPEVTEPIDLLELWWARRGVSEPTLEDLLELELPDVLPETIRVLRRYPDPCTGTDYPISEVDLDTYAAGVVTAEIGVFRALTTGEESQYEGFRTFAIAARSYALWFWARDPDAAWHLDDTACNQRYTDGPYPDIIDRAAQATSGMILVQSGTTATIDKFEYAASCGRCGSLPEYQTEIVPDVTSSVACTSGGWCGHNNCAGHEDNPACALEGPNVRCLVRGICQWGTAERSADGETYTEILGHYQPNLDIRDFGEEPTTRLLGFVRDGSIETGANIAGAVVGLDTGETATTGANGLFTIDGVEPGDRVLTVQADGYQPAEEIASVDEGVDNWHSVAMTRVQPPIDEEGVDAGGSDDPDLPEEAEADLGDEPDSPLDPIDAGRQQTGLSRFAVVGPEGLDSGCGCRLASRASPLAATIALLLLAPLLRARRRRTARLQ